MEHRIENEALRVTVSDHGAELVSVYDKEQMQERIWCANPSIWNRHAPILFPFVGKVKDGVYTYQGNQYPMATQHGFARDKEFTCTNKTPDSITHTLRFSEDTYRIYPFEFELHVTHSFCPDNPRQLIITWTVINLGTDEMFYSIGGHPGFCIPENKKRSDYAIALPDIATRSYLLLDSTGSGLADTSVSYPFNEKTAYVAISDHLFDKDALIFEGNQLPVVGIVDKNHNPFITLTCKDFPYVGIWSKPDGPFVCLEPWQGRTDNMDFSGDLSEKPGELRLPAKETAVHTYSIEFHACAMI